MNLFELLKRKKTLKKLLDLNPNKEEKQKLDCDAIIRAALRNPQSVDTEYLFSRNYGYPLHQAIILRAPVRVIEALSSSVALEAKVGRSKWSNIPFDEKTAIHLALEWGSCLSVIKLLLEKQPEAVREKNNCGHTPLHIACLYKASLEVVSLLVDLWPGAVREKDECGNTPIHLACYSRGWPKEILTNRVYVRWMQNAVIGRGLVTSPTVLELLLENRSGATLDKNDCGYTPLHIACKCKAPLEVLSLLLNSSPGAIQQKDEHGFMPLHIAARPYWPRYRYGSDYHLNTSMEAILLLIKNYPEAAIHKNKNEQTPFDLAPEATKTILFHAAAIFGYGNNHYSPKELMAFFNRAVCWKGVRLVLDKHPAVAKTINLPTNAMADFLSMVGVHCSLKTMWGIIRNEQELLAGAL